MDGFAVLRRFLRDSLLTTLLITGTVSASPPMIDGTAIADEDDGSNWPSYGRTYTERHASPLSQINAGNVHRLGLLWTLPLEGVTNGATVPLAIDGVLYFTVGLSWVRAVEARTGRVLWQFNPQVTRVAGRKLRYSWGPRGLAFWKGKVYVGTLDGRLIALDAGTGKVVWSVVTVDPNDERTITGAPRVFNDKVIIGHGGADIGPVRGYVTAYDAANGRQIWRFYVVPGNPKLGFENNAMEMAAKTWTGRWWRFGGGGTVWNAITYDPELNAIYLGTGNGAPWNRKIRSPGGGDNLFLSSIVALDADSGRYRWHYQTNPGDTWDYNSAMDITLATLTVQGRPRQVILHAPKNGFFYVIDRSTGALLAAEKFAQVNWAERIDMATGRPVENPRARYADGDFLLLPGSAGAHNWQPMSFNEALGLVFIPTIDMPEWYGDKGIDPVGWHHRPGQINTGTAATIGILPPGTRVGSSLLAWSPTAQRPAWRIDTPGVANGGTMTTAGDLVFQGQGDGQFKAYRASTGELLWSFDVGRGISGAPITYLMDGTQLVTVVAGWGGGAAAALGPLAAQLGWQAHVHEQRVVTFALDGRMQLPDSVGPLQARPLDDPGVKIDTTQSARGAVLYGSRCLYCHGAAVMAGGFAPDLRASRIPLSADAFRAVVHDGALESLGMPRYPELSESDLAGLRQYIRARARATLSETR